MTSDMTDSKSPKSNPIRDSKNRIKLGVFGINGNGAALTFHPDRYQCTWDSNLRLAEMADGAIHGGDFGIAIG